MAESFVRLLNFSERQSVSYDKIDVLNIVKITVLK